MTDRPARPPARLTLAYQALANLLGVLVVSVHHDQHFADMAQAMEDILPAARHDVPDSFRPVIEAAEAVALAWHEVRKGRGGAAWGRASLDASAALVRFFTSRALAALEAHHQERSAARAEP